VFIYNPVLFCFQINQKMKDILEKGELGTFDFFILFNDAN